jgi:hypothetical protein
LQLFDIEVADLLNRLVFLSDVLDLLANSTSPSPYLSATIANSFTLFSVFAVGIFMLILLFHSADIDVRLDDHTCKVIYCSGTVIAKFTHEIPGRSELINRVFSQF